MALPILLYGKSGVGKTFSCRNLDDAAIIRIVKKPLSFKNEKGVLNAYCGSLDDVVAAVKACPAKRIVIDDAGYLMTRLFMNRKRSGNQFEVYNEIAGVMWNLVNFIIDDIADDKTVYIVFHEEINDAGEAGLLTIGKLLDQKVNLAGMVTVTIHAIIKNQQHIFRTNSDGSDIAKSPYGMFDNIEIENDLQLVDQKIRKFYDM